MLAAVIIIYEISDMTITDVFYLAAFTVIVFSKVLKPTFTPNGGVNQ